MEGTIALFIPIITVIVTGLVIIMYFYFRSREKQLMIEKGLSYEQMIELMRYQKHGYGLLKAGIILIFFGIGLGSGMLSENATNTKEWIPFMIFVMTGLGFVVAYIIGRKYEKADKDNENGSTGS
ncbi:DUF6249 domain-containing protein [Melioribacter sp. OK-6-Me]|uniref:DUF6249 domain-containing protein n=1 Tax=unclassified Melioribacter TaxID=2627329 RepID=UPI003ED963D5